MTDTLKNFIIGLFIVAAIGIVIFVLLFLHPSVGDEAQTLHVRFANIDKVTKGTRVTFAGQPVGEVVDIQEVPEARLDQSYRQGEVYIYELTLKIDSGVHVYDSDQISVHTSGLLGERSIEITPKPAVAGSLRLVTANEVLYATTPGSIEDAFTTLEALAKKVGKTFDQISQEFKALQKEKFTENMSKSMANIREITDTLNQPEEWRNIIANLSTSTREFGETTGRLARGEGSIGQLLNRDEFYLRLNAIMTKLDTTMNDVNQYGVLFQNDKGWQRLRARRANLMQELCTPQQFRNFFNEEIDRVSTALERVSMVLDDPANQCHMDNILQDVQFAMVFKDLLRQVEGLENNIKIYNQQIVDLQLEEHRCCRPE
jgi:phospholipid/cholesterol/gamma-HCH transport system substrate-binding protein